MRARPGPLATCSPEIAVRRHGTSPPTECAGPWRRASSGWAAPYIDVVYIHDPDNHARQALEEAYPALEGLRAEGVVGAVGVGMNEPTLPTQFVTDTDIDAVLIAGRYTLLDQSADQKLLRVARARGVHVVAAGVYNSGILTSVEANPPLRLRSRSGGDRVAGPPAPSSV